MTAATRTVHLASLRVVADKNGVARPQLLQLADGRPEATSSGVPFLEAAVAEDSGGLTPLTLSSPIRLTDMLRLGLRGEIGDSRRLLDLGDDWDGAGSPGYVEETWVRAVDLLISIVAELSDEYAIRTDFVEIMPGSHGSIDFEIRLPSCRLFFSVPPSNETPVRYFGEDSKKRNSVKGTFDAGADLGWLMQWCRRS